MADVKVTVDLMRELTQVLEKEQPEINRFEETVDMLLQIKEMRERQQALMKQNIKRLCSLVEEDKQQLSNNPEREKYLAREANVNEQRLKATENRARAQKECLEVQDKIAQLDKLKADLAQERESVENDTTVVLPKIRYDLNLYNLICRISWQYDNSPDDVSGYVCNKGDVKPFSLNTKQNSQFFITNYLWDLIEEGGPGW